MSKQSKKEKRENEELDLILAQIQQQFEKDNSDTDEENSSESNDNAEFSEMLKELIMNADAPSGDKPSSSEYIIDEEFEVEEFEVEEAVTEEIVEENVEDTANIEIPEEALTPEETDDDLVEDVITEVLTVEEAPANEEPIPDEEAVVEESSCAEIKDNEMTEQPSESEDEVDGVLQLMFSHVATDVSEAQRESGTAIDNIINEFATESDEYYEQEEILPNVANEAVVEESTAVNEAPLTYFDEDEDSEENINVEDIGYVDGNCSDDEEYEPAVEDEVYDDSHEVDLPRLVLDPAEYTYDPLQNGLPDFTPVAVKNDEITSASAESEAIHSAVKEENSGERLDTNDISLLLNFGYGEEIKSRVGEEEAQKIFTEKYNEFTPESHRTPHGYCGKELTDKKESKKIREKFKSDKSIIIIQLVLVSTLALIMLALEGFFEFFSDRSSYLAIVAIETVLIAICFAILNKKIIAGVLGIVRFEANLYSIAAYLMLSFAISGIATSLIYLFEPSMVDESGLMLFGFCVILYIIFILSAELLNCIREANTFDLMYRSNIIRTAEEYTAPNSKKNSKVVSKGDARSFRLVKTSLISGYFKKSSNSVFASVNLIYIIGIVPILSLVAGAVSIIMSENIINGVYTMMTTTLLCIPFAYVLDPSVIEFVTSIFLRRDKIALIGYNAADELARTNTLCFDDTDSIEIISYTEIHPTKSADGNRNLDIAKRVFDALGGPLGEVSHKLDSEAVNSKKGDVVINSIAENGIEIYFDSAINILLGDKNYMQAHNIKVKTDSNLNTAIKGFDRSVVYMAFDGIPKLGFIITSKVKPEFADIVSLLAQAGIEAYVDTYEPQINDLYFEQNKSEDMHTVSVSKSEQYEYSDYKAVCDGQIICASDSFALAKAIINCREIVGKRKLHRRMLYAIIAGGFIISCLLALLLTVDKYAFFFGSLKSHITIVLNAAMLLALIPGTVSVSKMIKNKKTNKTKETK